MILFWLGNLTQWWADRRPLLTVEVSGFGVAQTPTVVFVWCYTMKCPQYGHLNCVPASPGRLYATWWFLPLHVIAVV